MARLTESLRLRPTVPSTLCLISLGLMIRLIQNVNSISCGPMARSPASQDSEQLSRRVSHRAPGVQVSAPRGGEGLPEASGGHSLRAHQGQA